MRVLASWSGQLVSLTPHLMPSGVVSSLTLVTSYIVLPSPEPARSLACGVHHAFVRAEDEFVAIDDERFHVTEAASGIAAEPAGSAAGGVLDVIVGRVEAYELVPEGYHKSHN